ncbi:hypothetical protein EER87_20855 [Salmonella enterica subsp. enterica serovar Mbandaka]|nr:hypothetical protein [Salmonella enterica subsp. enterica serovar Mbandaka]
MDIFGDKFITLVTEHVHSLEDAEYDKHTIVSEHGKSIYNDNTWRGFACRATRTELVQRACSINAINPKKYIDVFINKDTIMIGNIEIVFACKKIESPVYFFPERGIYAAACGEDHVYDVWLSWPCYPRGW